MCKTFNDVPLSLTYPSRINLTQINTFTEKSVKGVFYSFDSLTACRCNYCFQTIYNSTCWQLNYTAVTLSRLFKKQTERNVKGLGNDKVICNRHQRTVHHGILCIRFFVVTSNVVALLSAALMISNKLIWLTWQMWKCSITVTRSCWLSLKSFQTLHELSRWRTKQASLFSKPLQKF